MKRTRVVISAFAIATAALLARGPAAWSCSCSPEPTGASFRSATAVFVGLAATVEIRDGKRRAAFAVDEVYKGTVPRAASVVTAEAGDTCGVDFVAGERYVVFATDDEGVFSTHLCSGTTPDTTILAKAGYDVPRARYSVLEGEAPVGPAGTLPGAGRGASIVILASVLAAVAAASLVMGRRRRTPAGEESQP